MAAAALDTYGCHFQGRFIFDNDNDISEAKMIGLTDLNKKYELNEIVRGDSIFCATGITTSDMLTGIKINDKKYTSETLVTHKASNYKKIIKSTNNINEWSLFLAKNGQKKNTPIDYYLSSLIILLSLINNHF